jgi:class 3 adenylate cyclase
VEAERKQVTILFADMVGFTAFSERSGEEAAYTLMRSLSTLMAEAVREQGGVVQNFTGDGIMAVFGAFRRSGHVAPHFQSCNGSRMPDLNSRLNTARDRRCALASTPEQP